MKLERGDLWSYEKTHLIAVPVNCGYKANNRAIMGAGVAQQAAKRWPHLRVVWGMECARAASRRDGSTVDLFLDPISKCIMVPTKGLNRKAPELSWKLPSTLELIEKSTRQLAKIRSTTFPVALPLLGCGYGGLERENVLPLLERYLDDRFTLVEL